MTSNHGATEYLTIHFGQCIVAKVARATALLIQLVQLYNLTNTRAVAQRPIKPNKSKGVSRIAVSAVRKIVGNDTSHPGESTDE